MFPQPRNPSIQAVPDELHDGAVASCLLLFMPAITMGQAKPEGATGAAAV